MSSDLAEGTVPDPDEGALDDLDGMLDEFSGPDMNPSSAIPSRTSTSRASVQQTASSVSSADAFNKELQDQMAALMGSLNEELPIQQEIGIVMKDLGSASDRVVLSESIPDLNHLSNRTEQLSDGSFQETIQNTMKRMQASGEHASTATCSDESDELLTQWMKELEDGSADGLVDNEGLQSMLMGMMEQLTNKEVLYDPMKELQNKYPDWIDKHKHSTDAEDIERYQVQQQLVDQIVQRFERKDYADSNADDREFIVEKMQKMQAAGSPPSDLVGDMKAAQDTLANIDQGCSQQ